jgi:hypothetical protein
MTTTTPIDVDANATKGANHANTRKTVTCSTKLTTFPTLPKRRRQVYAECEILEISILLTLTQVVPARSAIKCTVTLSQLQTSLYYKTLKVEKQ